MPRTIHIRFTLLVVLFVGSTLRAADVVSTQAELDRVKALVGAGALPRKALADAERGYRRAQLLEAVRRTLLNTDLSEREIPRMLEAVAALREMARENRLRALALVEAGAMPSRNLKQVEEETAFAEKQFELAESRAKIVWELAAMARAEQRLTELEDEELAFLSEGTITFWERDLPTIDAVFFEQFGLSLPLSAVGDTEVHRAMGFDHRDRVDVALHPDENEGIFLITLLENWGIPYIAFRSAVPGQATGAHIHIGPRSEGFSGDAKTTSGRP